MVLSFTYSIKEQGLCLVGQLYIGEHFGLGQRAPLLQQRFNNHVTTAGATTTYYQRKMCC